MAKKRVSFDPEGDDYDYATAKAIGYRPDETGHWSSRDYKTGMLLKGKNHETWDLTIMEENKLGNIVFKGMDGRYYSKPPEELTREEIFELVQ